jgi:UDP-N-acetylglucosamine 2-epimerase (non-hydrolysing)
MYQSMKQNQKRRETHTKVMTVFGIRPDWIKGCMVIKELDKTRGIKHIIVHAGQHYSYNLDKIFFEELELRRPDYNLEVGSGTQGEQTAKIIQKSEKVMIEEKPDTVLLLGDSNTSLTGISAAKLNIKVARIEAGMRAYDWRMPEEKNKRLIDHVATYLFAYTHYQRENLLLESIPYWKIHITGNPTVDTLNHFSKRAEKSQILDRLGIEPKNYFLATLHRAENVEDKKTLTNILKGLNQVAQHYCKRVVLPLMPRTKKRIQEFEINIPKNILTIEPQGFLEFLKLQMHTIALLTDSGTAQEEGCILKIPCVVTRISTERPETVELGSSIVAGTEPQHIFRAVQLILKRKANWQHPYGDGKTAQRIAKILKDYKLPDMLTGDTLNSRVNMCFSPFLTKGAGHD